MKNTLFLDELNLRFPVPLLAIEYFNQSVAQDSSDESRLASIEFILKEICGVEEPIEEDYAYLMRRFIELQKLAEETANDSAGRPPRKSFWTSMQKFLNDLNASEILILMANGDISVARNLYCKTDFKIVRAIINNYVKMLREQGTVYYEAALYGSGNRYKGDSGGRVIDADSKEGKAKLSALGFGFIDMPPPEGMFKV